MWFYEILRLQALVRAINVLPQTIKAMEDILPPIQLNFTPLGRALPPQEKSRGRILFFTGCIQEGFLSAVNAATIRVLQRNGYEVLAPAGQTCCGAAQLHLGDKEFARQLARQNIDIFSAAGDCQAILNNAGGCGVSLKEYPHLLADDSAYADRARQFAAKVQDVNEFLSANLSVPPRGEVRARATYSDSCHLRHGQKVVRQPRDLLRLIPGLQLIELAAPDRCCGSAGVYNIAQVDTANAILDAKMEDIAATGADLVVTSNTGCYMQLVAGMRRAGLKARVRHVVEVLDESYSAEEYANQKNELSDN
jgi:glycolate oxidase iron-sulfur subunit